MNPIFILQRFLSMKTIYVFEFEIVKGPYTKVCEQ